MDQNLNLLINSDILAICYVQEGKQMKPLELEYGQSVSLGTMKPNFDSSFKNHYCIY